MKQTVRMALWATLALHAAAAPCAWAQLLAYEGFDYPTGLLATANGGAGWPGAWTAGNGAGNRVAEPDASYTNGAFRLVTEGNRMSYTGANTENFRSLPAIYGADGTTVYLSFLARVQTANYADVALFNNTTHNFALGRIINTTTWGVSRTARGTGLTTLSTTNQAFLVCRLTFAAGNVTVRLYVNPPLDAEPATSDIGDMVWPGFSFNRLRLRSGATAVDGWVDELRLGSTYADVAPYGAGPGVPLARVNDVTVKEGNADNINAQFVVRLSEPSTQTVAVAFATVNGTAEAGTDFVGTNGTATFLPGETNQTIAVAVLGDTEVEPDESFNLVLTNAVNAVLADPLGAGIIRDDDFVLPALIAADSFDYPVGPLNGADGGTGWTEAWAQSGAGNNVATPGRQYQTPDWQLVTAGNAVAFSGANNGNSRRLPRRLGEEGQRLYVSFVGQVFSGQYGGLFLTDGLSDRYFMGRLLNQTVWGCGQFSGADGVATTKSTTNESLLVFRYDFAGSNVAVRVFVNPPLDAEPSAPDASVVASPFGFDGVRLAGGNSSVTGTLDELRLGATYAAVTPRTLRPPRLRISDATVTEGDPDTTNLLFTLSLSRTNDQSVSVDFATTDGSATAGADYTSTNGSVTFPPGATNQTLAIAVIGDALLEPDETVFVSLSNAANATLTDAQGRGTILDDDTPPQIAIAPGRVLEGNDGITNALFRVQLTRAFKLPVSVDFATTNATATAGSDYTGANGTVVFAPGETHQAISVPVHGDKVVEPNERYLVGLGNALNGFIAEGLAEGLIGDDDASKRFGAIVTVVETDDAVPGEPGRVFTKFLGPPVINDFDELAFIALTDNATGTDPETGVWFAADGQLRKLASDKMEPPNGPSGAKYSGVFTALNLGDDGTVSFVAELNLPAPAPLPGGASATAGVSASPGVTIVALYVVREVISLLAPAVQEVREAARQHHMLPGLEHLGTVQGIGGQSGYNPGSPLHSAEGMTFTVTTEGAPDAWATYYTQPFSLQHRVLAGPGEAGPTDPEETITSAWPVSAQEGEVVVTLTYEPTWSGSRKVQSLDRISLAGGPPRSVLRTGDPLPGGATVEDVVRAIHGQSGDLLVSVRHQPRTPTDPFDGIYRFPRSPPPQVCALGSPDGSPTFHFWLAANRRSEFLVMRDDAPGLRLQVWTSGDPPQSADGLVFGETEPSWPDGTRMTVAGFDPRTMSLNDRGVSTVEAVLNTRVKALWARQPWGSPRLPLIAGSAFLDTAGNEHTATDLFIARAADSGSGGPRGLNTAGQQAVQFTVEPVSTPPNPAAGGILRVSVNKGSEFTAIRKNADGTITIKWLGGGTFQAAPSVLGPWTDVSGATSPYTLTPTAAMLFGRVRP